jgi:hypothetical protein
MKQMDEEHLSFSLSIYLDSFFGFKKKKIIIKIKIFYYNTNANKTTNEIANQKISFS